jgi:hypothetical protein
MSDTPEDAKKGPEVPLTRTLHATADLMAGMAEAFRKGFETFHDKVNEDNVTRLGWKNGVMEGTITGMMDTLEELPRVARRFYTHVTTETEPRPQSKPEIDYERLAKMVAAEMSAKGQ